jgi:hypothetical protein
MIPSQLAPSMDLLREEYVLVQAWKKAARYIRFHNWYSDTLAIDLAEARLPYFLDELRDRLTDPDSWQNAPLRLVLAPKSHRWTYTNGNWQPGINPDDPHTNPVKVPLRPLGHVALQEQVAATAVMLCLANRVETRQGDPRTGIEGAESRRQVVSYGSRLFCDKDPHGGLHHRWGAAKLYRAYSQDYRTFLSRPEAVAREYDDRQRRLIVVHSDLSKFFDRVRPSLMHARLSALQQQRDDPSFFTFARRLLDWRWHEDDQSRAAKYAHENDIVGFSAIALPQGLVASGFLANVVLLDFDDALRRQWQEEEGSISLLDSCRYVDDFRLMFAVDGDATHKDVEKRAIAVLGDAIKANAPGLEVAQKKTEAASFGGEQRVLLRQSRQMEKIQHAVSGGFDVVAGDEILNAVQGLLRVQQRYPHTDRLDGQWALSPVPDVRDATVARFAAERYRRTVRSLRPMLLDRDEIVSRDAGAGDDTEDTSGLRAVRTQRDLDDDTRAFALGLIEMWIADPSHVRLLRIGLDLWPDSEVLTIVLDTLHALLERERDVADSGPRAVATYCLAELLRAGATETGLVEDSESLPQSISLSKYRMTLREEAIRILSMDRSAVPWYLEQQTLLFLATYGHREPLAVPTVSPESSEYANMLRYLKGDSEGLTDVEFAAIASTARRTLRSQDEAVRLGLQALSSTRLERLAQCDPGFAVELLSAEPGLRLELTETTSRGLCLASQKAPKGFRTVAEHVLTHREGSAESLRNELRLLEFAEKVLEHLRDNPEPPVLLPTEVFVRVPNSWSKPLSLRVRTSGDVGPRSLYAPPQWCSPSDQWRFKVGFLMRYVLSGRVDFTQVSRPPSWREDAEAYRLSDSSWYQRIYGMHNGHSSFGDLWLPISEWIERLLAALLRWPGCHPGELDSVVSSGLESCLLAVQARIEVARESIGTATQLMMLRLSAPNPNAKASERPLHACIVQTVRPNVADIKAQDADLTLSDKQFRKTHRDHLSSTLKAIERMLDLRKSHCGSKCGLDLLVLPELALHPADIKTHVLPFVRTHKAIVLAGTTYQSLDPKQLLVNAALWVIPKLTPQHGLQVDCRLQGKQHLAREEIALNSPTPRIRGFRPCQWLVGYDWAGPCDADPLWLTAAICYDATDLKLAADLRTRSDVFAIPALNQDYETFDHMAAALHYHMFQMVVVVNNGQFGGSCAVAPYKEAFKRELFHLHGQPQASIGFFEIEDIGAFKRRHSESRFGSVGIAAPAQPSITPVYRWKFPPAGL